MSRDAWDPQVYNRFAEQRAAPARDLLGMLAPVPGGRVADLGCGTGALTAELHAASGAARTLGLDGSAAMLAQAPRDVPGLAFAEGAIETFAPPPELLPLDVVFSNAALHWVGDHPALLARLRGWLAPGGQLAIQMPDNMDLVTHRVAREVAAQAPFAGLLGGEQPRPRLLAQEDYATLLHELGFAEQRVERRVYPVVLDDRESVVEWFRGSLLAEYERRLEPAAFADLLDAYRARLLPQLADRRPFFLPFPRLLLWGRLPIGTVGRTG